MVDMSKLLVDPATDLPKVFGSRMTFEPGSPGHGSRLLHQLLEVTQRISAAGHRAAGAFELTAPAANALSLIDPAAPQPSMRELAARLRVDPSRVTALCDELEAADLIERHPDPGNRRVKLLSLTARGATVRSTVVHSAIAASPLSLLTVGEQGELGVLLDKILGGTVSDACHHHPDEDRP
jgi:DNA-binding MarR family transcriptional regulator